MKPLSMLSGMAVLHLQMYTHMWLRQVSAATSRYVSYLIISLFLHGQIVFMYLCCISIFQTDLVTISSIGFVLPDCEKDLKEAVAKRPVVAGIQMDQQYKQYKGVSL